MWGLEKGRCLGLIGQQALPKRWVPGLVKTLSQIIRWRATDKNTSVLCTYEHSPHTCSHTHTCSYTFHTHIHHIPGVIDGTDEIVYIPIVCSSVSGKFCHETLTFICCDASAGDSRGLSLANHKPPISVPTSHTLEFQSLDTTVNLSDNWHGLGEFFPQA